MPPDTEATPGDAPETDPTSGDASATSGEAAMIPDPTGADSTGRTLPDDEAERTDATRLAEDEADRTDRALPVHDESDRTPAESPTADATAPPDVSADERTGEEQPTEEPERVAPGDPPILGPAEPWEVGAMTTPDYRPPQSIHDAGHDAWPVDAADGSAVPAWDNGEKSTDDDDALDDIGELLLDEVVPADPWDTEPEPDEPDSEPFPLDAFIVPAGVPSVSSGHDEVALRVAHRLDELARRLRDDGLSSLGRASGVDELSRVLAAIVTGYVAGDTG